MLESAVVVFIVFMVCKDDAQSHCCTVASMYQLLRSKHSTCFVLQHAVCAPAHKMAVRQPCDPMFSAVVRFATETLFVWTPRIVVMQSLRPA